MKEDIQAMLDIGLLPYWKIPGPGKNNSDNKKYDNKNNNNEDNHDDKKEEDASWLSGQVDEDVFQKFVGSQAEEEAWSEYQKTMPMMTGSHSLVARGMYELQIRQWFKHFHSEQFLVMKLEDMAVEGGVQRCVERAFRHVGLPPDYRVKDVSPKNMRCYNPMSLEIKELLERFYAPHNRRLEEVLGGDCDNDSWKVAW